MAGSARCSLGHHQAFCQTRTGHSTVRAEPEAGVAVPGRHSQQEVGDPTNSERQGFVQCPVGSIAVHADADWAGDSADRRSLSGSAAWLRLRNGWVPLAVTCRKQSTVSLSSGESEIAAVVDGAVLGLGFLNLAQELLRGVGETTGEQLGLVLCNDSSCAISVIRRRGAGRRTRHLMVKVFYLQGLARMEHVTVLKAGTSLMFADMATKVGNWGANHFAALGLIDESD